MAIQESGVISVSSLASEFGDGQPFSLSEYYRGGGLVPSNVETVSSVRDPASGDRYVCMYTGDWQYGQGQSYWASGFHYPASAPDRLEIAWANGSYTNEIFTGTVNGDASDVTTWTSGKWTYRRGVWRSKGDQESYYDARQGDFYGIYRSEDTHTTGPGNEEVPESGTLSLSDFYGATAT